MRASSWTVSSTRTPGCRTWASPSSVSRTRAWSSSWSVSSRAPEPPRAACSEPPPALAPPTLSADAHLRLTDNEDTHVRQHDARVLLTDDDDARVRQPDDGDARVRQPDDHHAPVRIAYDRGCLLHTSDPAAHPLLSLLR